MPSRITALAISLLLVASARTASAQTCPLDAPPFAGHAFPADGTPTEPGTVGLVGAFPNLVFTRPVFLTHAPDGSDRIFVVEQAGRIRVFPNSDAVASTSLFLDIASLVASSGGEQGLLGLAFDPDYATNGFFYVHYTASASACVGAGFECSKIVRYRVSSGNPDAADPASALELMQYAQPDNDHNGGMLAFGPDTMLYIASGDGGDGQAASGQDLGVRLGKILRIDPGAPAPYIPPTNPFADDPTRAREIWHYGLRNPWRFSFDRLTGDLWIGDVGENEWEEIDFLPAGHAGGANFGWDVCEGNHDFAGSCSELPGVVAPVFEYSHTSGLGVVVVGGYVYRGTGVPSLYGKYVFGDGATGRVLAWDRISAPIDIGTAPALSSFGEDQSGELYALALFDGRVYRVVPAGGGGGGFPALLSQTGLFSSTASLTPAPGMIEYEVAVPFWSDNALKRRWIALPAGARVGFDPDRAWEVPPGTALVKHFDIPIGAGQTRRLETRVLLHQPASATSPAHWVGVTYRWNAQQTDANLLTSALDESIALDTGSGPEQQPYHYPAPFECLQCHNPVAGDVLGLRTAQMNHDFAYPGGSANQLSAWQCAGLLTPNPGSPAVHAKLADPSDAALHRTIRSRAWLDVNCSMCHLPGGLAPGAIDLRRQPLLGDMNAIGVAPTQGSLGIPNARRIFAGSSGQSVLWARVQSSQVGVHMPPQGRAVDPAAIELLRQWIDADLAVLDSDADGRADGADNCPYVANDQRDVGGVGLVSGPDGIGDACQCGDLYNDGRITSADATLLRNGIAAGGGSLNLALCNVHDPAAGPAGRCDLVDVVTLTRALARVAPGIAPRCRAAGVIP
jgi:uncharacterized repeat protein (TIGR03806 family)